MRLEEDGVLRARVVHRAAFQTHFVGDGSRGLLRVWGEKVGKFENGDSIERYWGIIAPLGEE